MSGRLMSGSGCNSSSALLPSEEGSNSWVSNSDQERLVVEQDKIHQPLPVIAALFGKLLLMLTIFACGFLVPVFHHAAGYESDSFSVMQYVHVILWAIITILTWYVKGQHKQSRIFGYHQFYNNTRHLHRITFYVVSSGNVLLMVIGSLVSDFCLGSSVSPCSTNTSLTPVNYQQIVFTFENIFTLPFLIRHIVLVCQFNQAAQPPDVLAEDVALRYSRPDSYIGVRGPSSLDWVLERQADLLQVLRHRNAILTQQVYVLMQQIQQQQQHA